MDDGRSERALGGVVGRLDAGDGAEGPEREPDLEEVVGELAGAPVLGAGVFEQRAELGLDRRDLVLEPLAVVVLVLVGARRRRRGG